LGLLDVGQGLALVVQTRQHALLYDSGDRFSAHFNAGDAVILPYLRQRGIERLDTLVISHGDRDHRGGMEAILTGMPVDRVLSSEAEIIDRFGAQPCLAGQHWQWDGVQFRLLHPPADYSGSDNNRTCVMQVQAGEHRILLGGDIEKRAEYHLVREFGHELAAEILLVPHHGSNTSSSRRFLAHVRPELVLLPVGYGNRFNLPSDQVLERYRASGGQILSTASHGTIELRLQPGQRPGEPLTGWQRRRFWHWR
jgi:competence protein ComEC